MQTLWLKKRQLRNTEPALDRSNSLQFLLAPITKLGMRLIHDMSVLKQHSFDCGTVLLIEKPGGHHCGSDFSFLTNVLVVRYMQITDMFYVAQFAKLRFICWGEVSYRNKWATLKLTTCPGSSWTIRHLFTPNLILQITLVWQTMSFKCACIISGSLSDGTSLLFWLQGEHSFW